jgi:pimeloyl-ACP methyl ester carboxylesterase
MSVVPQAIMLDDWGGPPIAGVLSPADSAFSIVFLHDEVGDLDQASAVSASQDLADIRRIALDLPGHGLSADCPEDQGSVWLEQTFRILADRGFAPFVIAGFGRSAALAHRLAVNTATLGLVVIAPRGAIDVATPSPRGVPLLAFVSGIEEEADENWRRLRDTVHLPWTVISLAIPSIELLSPAPMVAATIASHVSGFAREAHSLKKRTSCGSGCR